MSKPAAKRHKKLGLSTQFFETPKLLQKINLICQVFVYFNFDIVNKSNISNTVLLKSPCIVMGPLDAHVSSYRVWNEKKEQSNILICQLISPFIVFFVKISYSNSYHKGNKKPGLDAVCIIITHNVTLNGITTKARSTICVWLFFLSDSATVV